MTNKASFCRGKHCPVKNTCRKYTEYLGIGKLQDKCTSQKGYVQDVRKINQDSLKR